MTSFFKHHIHEGSHDLRNCLLLFCSPESLGFENKLKLNSPFYRLKRMILLFSSSPGKRFTAKLNTRSSFLLFHISCSTIRFSTNWNVFNHFRIVTGFSEKLRGQNPAWYTESRREISTCIKRPKVLGRRGIHIQSAPRWEYKRAEYFSKDGGDILDADYAKLKNALSDNPESMKHLNTYRTLGYVSGEWREQGLH